MLAIAFAISRAPPASGALELSAAAEMSPKYSLSNVVRSDAIQYCPSGSDWLVTQAMTGIAVPDEVAAFFNDFKLKKTPYASPR